MVRLSIALLALFALSDGPALARRSAPPSPTPLDNTTWTVMAVNNAPIVGSATIAFSNNSRMQVFTSCEILLGGYYFTLLGGLRIYDLSAPRRIACLAELLEQDRKIHALIVKIRSYRKSQNGSRITFRTSDKQIIEAQR